MSRAGIAKILQIDASSLTELSLNSYSLSNQLNGKIKKLNFKNTNSSIFGSRDLVELFATLYQRTQCEIIETTVAVDFHETHYIDYGRDRIPLADYLKELCNAINGNYKTTENRYIFNVGKR